MGAIQRELGGLAEAIETLKVQSKEQRDKLDIVRSEIDTAKGAGKAVWVGIGALGAIVLVVVGIVLTHMFGGAK